MITIFGHPGLTDDGKYFGVARNGAGTTFDTSDPANIPSTGVGYAGVFPRDVIVSSASVYSEDPTNAGSINFVLRVDGVDTPVVLSLDSGQVFVSKSRLTYSSLLNLIIPAGKLFAVRTDYVGAPVSADFLFVMETYFV